MEFLIGTSVLACILAMWVRKRQRHLCGYCDEEYHPPKICTVFRRIKSLCTTEDYIGKELLQNDMEGCCAAGVIPFVFDKESKKYKFFVTQEKRYGNLKYNFLGGKRNERCETPWMIACRELIEEIPDEKIIANTKTRLYPRRQRNDNHLVLWSANSKYALFSLRLDYEDYLSYQKIQFLRNLGIHEIEVDMSLDPDEWHPFAYSMIERIESERGLLGFLLDSE